MPTVIRPFAAFAVAMFGVGACLHAGPLDPPAGPITSTSKPLAEVEPRVAINATNTPGDANSLYKITAPGSYYLTGNVAGVAGKRGIEIAASGVTVDLNGFTLDGPAGSLEGIAGDGSGFLRNIEIRNGCIQNWDGAGIDLAVPGSEYHGCVIRSIRTYNNEGGISAGSDTLVTECVAYLNSGVGITTTFGCTVAYCNAEQNNGGGIVTSSGCTVSNCTARANTGDGISVAAGCTVTACTASSNSAVGIHTGIGGNVTNNASRGNDDGIRVSNASRVVGNECAENTGDGIVTSGFDVRIEGNNSCSQTRGINVSGAGNFIVRNTCSGNATNWVIAANNVFGPILDRSAPASAAVSGNAAPSSLGSTDANANFTY